MDDSHSYLREPGSPSLSGRLFAVLWMLAACGIFMLLMTLAMPAMAQDGGSVVDVGPLITDALVFLAPAIVSIASLLGLWVLTGVARWLGLKIDAGHRAAVEQGLERAVGYALERVGDHVKGGIPIDMRHTAIATAAQYARSRIPGALRHFGVTERSLAEMIESRLEGLIVDPAAEDDGLRVGRLRTTAMAATV